MRILARASTVALCLFALFGLGRAHDSPNPEPSSVEEAGRSTPTVRLEVLDGPNPWTDKKWNHDARNFQFAVISDRTGGHRPGVFENAIRKINLLQPEFVMSVGDLIEGYTEDETELVRQWDEVDQFIDQLEMKFFYVPGNHDISNPFMARLWEKRLGRPYYHFVYQDVLFLCLNSEDTRRGFISPAQVEYVSGVLKEVPAPRWTLVFMHQPLWVYEDHFDDLDTGWSSVEALLHERKHTVIVGHFHRYSYNTRKGNRYLILATSGGVTGGRGRTFGELDHVTWITMTDQGPRIANLALDGILEEDFHPAEGERFLQWVFSSVEVDIAPPLLEGNEFRGGTATVTVINASSDPIEVGVTPPVLPGLKFEPGAASARVGPGTKESLPIRLDTGGAIVPLTVPLEFLVTVGSVGLGAQQLVYQKRVACMPQQRLSTVAAPAELVVDGDLGEWSVFPHECRMPGEASSGSGPDWTGPEDGSFAFAVATRSNALILAVAVTDDHVMDGKPGAAPWDGDGVEIRMSAQPGPWRETERGSEPHGLGVRLFAMGLCPAQQIEDTVSFFKPHLPEGLKMRVARRDQGYGIEVEVPFDQLRRHCPGSDLAAVRLNVAVNDLDPGESQRASLWWQPDWRSEGRISGSGVFALGNDH